MTESNLIADKDARADIAKHSETIDAITEFKAQKDQSERRATMFTGIMHNHILAMQAAVIDSEINGPAEGMKWIGNTLCGPGLYPDVDAAKAMGGAQAFFDSVQATEPARLAAIDAATKQAQDNLSSKYCSATAEQVDRLDIEAGWPVILGYYKSAELASSKQFGGSLNIFMQKFNDCDSVAYAQREDICAIMKPSELLLAINHFPPAAGEDIDALFYKHCGMQADIAASVMNEPDARLERIAATGTADSFMALPDAQKRLWFASWVSESNRKKKALQALEQYEHEASRVGRERCIVEAVEHLTAALSLHDAQQVIPSELFKRMFKNTCAALELINEALGLDPDASAAEAIDAIAEFKAQKDEEERRATMFAGIMHNHILAMQAAVIDSEINGPAEGIEWISNTLFGPGLYPDVDAAKAMGGAQAYFDAETATEAARLATIDAATKRAAA